MRAYEGCVDETTNFRVCWVPRLRNKPFALEPLAREIVEAQAHVPSKPVRFENVYSSEIKMALKHQVGRSKQVTLDEIESVPFKPLDATELDFVTTEGQLEKLIEEVTRLGEVAIDLEHNDFRSYRGITCLIQLSTREKDYIIDPFGLFDSITRLNRITTNPNIRKVFHAGELDIIWLQRDFGVYIVNMFDTSQAAQVAAIEGGSGLANLLKVCCNVSTNKEFQMADWTQRPLSDGMLRYARMDTHYLLYIRDELERRILTHETPGTITAWGRNMLTQVYEKSAGISLKSYEDVAPDFEPAALKKFLARFQAPKLGDIKTNKKCLATLIGALKWRDQLARRKDESKHFVLSNADCLKVAKNVPGSVNHITKLLANSGKGPFGGMRIGPKEADDLLHYIQREVEMVI
jgi:exosome complex exonuclease RRP6